MRSEGKSRGGRRNPTGAWAAAAALGLIAMAAGCPHGQTPVASTAPEQGGQARGDGEEPAPTSVSVTIRNQCRDRVDVFFGDDPRFGGGRHSGMNGNSRRTHRFDVGDQFWLTDGDRNGISSATVSANTSEIEILENCTGMVAR